MEVEIAPPPSDEIDVEENPEHELALVLKHRVKAPLAA
jgi:hypothetical protein